MTQAEAKERSAAKVKELQEHMQKLEIALEGRQRVDPRTGFMEIVVVYNDKEAYDIEKEPAIRVLPPNVQQGPASPDA